MVLLVAPILTCIFEIPVIKVFRVVKTISYIVATNILTNLVLNCGALLFSLYAGNTATAIWNFSMELFIIPVSEALIYRLISDAKFAKIILVSYLANFLSWGLGYLLISFLPNI